LIAAHALLAYGLVGLILAIAFLSSGLSRTLPHRSLTLGARLLLLPGIIALWPLILGRWLRSRGRR
jgi:hypothetical protein